MKGLPARDGAWALPCEHVKGPNLRCHSLAVEAVMRHAARKRGEDEDAWGAVGLIHFVDYERSPDEHRKHTPRTSCAPRAGARTGSGLSSPTGGDLHRRGARTAMLGVALDGLVADTIDGMRSVAGAIGHKGTL